MLNGVKNLILKASKKLFKPVYCKIYSTATAG